MVSGGLLAWFRMSMNYDSQPIFKPYEMQAAFHPDRSVRQVTHLTLSYIHYTILHPLQNAEFQQHLRSQCLAAALPIWPVLRLVPGLCSRGLVSLRPQKPLLPHPLCLTAGTHSPHSALKEVLIIIMSDLSEFFLNLIFLNFSDRMMVGMSLALLLLPFLPASGILLRVGFVIAERCNIVISCLHLSFPHRAMSLFLWLQNPLHAQSGVLPTDGSRSQKTCSGLS